MSITEEKIKEFEEKFGSKEDWMKGLTPFMRRSQIDFYEELKAFLVSTLEQVVKETKEDIVKELRADLIKYAVAENKDLYFIKIKKIKKKKKKCYCCALCGDTPKYPAIGCPVHDKSLIESI